MDSSRQLQQDGADVTYLPVQHNGIVTPEAVEEAILAKPAGSTLLVSIMLVNNEIGVIQPIEEIAKVCRRHNVFLHTDAAQAVGKVRLESFVARVLVGMRGVVLIIDPCRFLSM